MVGVAGGTRRQPAACLLAAAVGLAAGASRADPTKEDCIDANESAQALRASGKLREAEDKLTLCVAHSCPGPVRSDCAERLDEVQKALPTVVFAVRTDRGEDLTAVQVSVDGAPLTAVLGGSAIAVDPGSHTFAFEATGFVTSREEVLVREGEKERSVSVVLRAAGEARARPGPVVPPPAAGPAGLSARRWVALVSAGVGGIGLAVGGVVATAAKSQYDAAEKETGSRRHTDSANAVDTGNVATVAVSVGGLLAVAGAVLWLTAPSASTQVGTGVSQVFLKGSF